jgi:hypothetical protein
MPVAPVAVISGSLAPIRCQWSHRALGAANRREAPARSTYGADSIEPLVTIPRGGGKTLAADLIDHHARIA